MSRYADQVVVDLVVVGTDRREVVLAVPLAAKAESTKQRSLDTIRSEGCTLRTCRSVPEEFDPSEEQLQIVVAHRMRIEAVVQSLAIPSTVGGEVQNPSSAWDGDREDTATANSVELDSPALRYIRLDEVFVRVIIARASSGETIIPRQGRVAEKVGTSNLDIYPTGL